MNRAAEFSHLAARAIDPAYRRLWQSQAEYYGEAKAEAKAKVGVSEVSPGPACVSLVEKTAFRLPAESSWAALFDVLGVTYQYTTRFWLPDRATWLEIQEAAPTETELRAARGLAANGHRVYMVTGWPRRKGFGVWVVAEAGEFVAVRADFRDLAVANLLGVSFGRLYEAFSEVKE